MPSCRTIISALSVGQILVWAVMYYGFSSFVLPMQPSVLDAACALLGLGGYTGLLWLLVGMAAASLALFALARPLQPQS